MIIRVPEVGLAAYLRLKKAKFIAYDRDTGSFVFDTDKDKNAWMVEYLGTDCYEHDKEVITMRKFKQKR